MKKLLIVTNTMGRAGAEKSLVSLLRGLDYDRCSVHLLSIINRGTLYADIPGEVVVLNKKPCAKPVLGWRGALRIAGLSLARLPRGGFRCIPSMIRRAAAQIRAGCLQPDKLLWPMLAQTTPEPDGEYDLAIAFLEGASTYYVANRVRARVKMAFVHVNYEKAGYSRAYDAPYYGEMSYICCVSEGVRRALAGVYPEYAGKMRLFPNIIDPRLIRAGAQQPGGFTDGFAGARLLTVARLHPQKGLPMAIDAMTMLLEKGHAVRWYIIGDGLEMRKLRKLAKQKGLADCFILMGARDNPYPYMRQCDIYVQPSAFEGMSLTLMEALMLGKACVTTQFDGMPDLLTDGQDALIVPYDASKLASALDRLLDNEALRQKIAAGTANIPFHFVNETPALYALMDGVRWEEA